MQLFAIFFYNLFIDVRSIAMSLLSFLILVICIFFYPQSLQLSLSFLFIFSRNQISFSFMFSTVFIFSFIYLCSDLFFSPAFSLIFFCFQFLGYKLGYLFKSFFMCHLSWRMFPVNLRKKCVFFFFFLLFYICLLSRWIIGLFQYSVSLLIFFLISR